MSAQSVIADARLIHVRELKSEVERLKAENARLREESQALAAHFDLAVLAVRDLAMLEGDARLVIVDGWNRILGADRTARSRADLERQMRAHLAERPRDFVWIVYDGARFSSVTEGRLRVSYTGGSGLHRADRFVCDFLRMARLAGDASRIEVVTSDKDFRKAVDGLRTEQKSPRPTGTEHTP